MRLPSNLNRHCGGNWHAPSGGSAPILNPATGKKLADAPVADAANVDRCVEAAWRVIPGWRASALETRAAALRQIANVIRKNIASSTTLPLWLLKLRALPIRAPRYVARRAMDVAAKIAQGPAEAFGSIKRLIAMSQPSLEWQTARESDMIARQVTGTESKEGIAAFLQKRVPNFQPSVPGRSNQCATLTRNAERHRRSRPK